MFLRGALNSSSIYFSTSVVKGLQVKVRKFSRLVSTFGEVIGEKRIRGEF